MQLENRKPETPGLLASAQRRRRRLVGLVVALACGALLAAAAMLSPNPAGHGTHKQELGLPVCGFLVRTGYPCPSCGMTTSLAAMAHGQIGLAFRAHLFGVLVFAAVVAAMILAAVQAVTGRNVLGRVRPRRWQWWLAGAITAWLGGWGLKVAIGVATGQYPVGI